MHINYIQWLSNLVAIYTLHGNCVAFRRSFVSSECNTINMLVYIATIEGMLAFYAGQVREVYVEPST